MGCAAAIAGVVGIAGIAVSASADKSMTSTSTVHDPLGPERSKGLESITDPLKRILEAQGVPGATYNVLADYTNLTPETAKLPGLTDIEQKAMAMMKDQLVNKGLLTDYDILNSLNALREMGLPGDYFFAPQETEWAKAGLFNIPAASSYSDLLSGTSFANIGENNSFTNLMAGSTQPEVQKGQTEMTTFLKSLNSQNAIKDIATMITSKKATDILGQNAAATLQKGASGIGLMDLIKTWQPLAALPKERATLEKTDEYSQQQRLMDAYYAALNIPSLGTSSSGKSTAPTDWGGIISGIGGVANAAAYGLGKL